MCFYCRKNIVKDKEEIMLNVPKMAKGHDYFAVTGLSVSTNEQFLIKKRTN